MDLDDLNITPIAVNRDGRALWVWPSGLTAPVVRGGDGPEGEVDPPAGGDDLSKLNGWAQSIATREKREGKAAAVKEIAEQLGMTPTEAAEFITTAKAAQAAGLTEAERKLAEAADKDRAATAREQAATERETSALKRAALVEHGLPRDQAKTIARLVDVDGDITETTVDAAVEALKKSMPHLFAATTETKGPPDSKTKGGPPAQSHGATSLADRGKELAAKYGLPQPAA